MGVEPEAMANRQVKENKNKENVIELKIVIHEFGEVLVEDRRENPIIKGLEGRCGGSSCNSPSPPTRNLSKGKREPG